MLRLCTPVQGELGALTAAPSRLHLGASQAVFPNQELGTAVPITTPPPNSAVSPSSPPPRAAQNDGDALGREEPVFVQSLPEAEEEQTQDKARSQKWSLGFLPGYSSIPDHERLDEDDEEDNEFGAGPRDDDDRTLPPRAHASPQPPGADVVDSASAPRAQRTALPFELTDSPTQIEADLGVARNNAQVAQDCMSVITDEQGGELATNEVLQELLSNLRRVEPRIVGLIESGQVRASCCCAVCARHMPGPSHAAGPAGRSSRAPGCGRDLTGGPLRGARKNHGDL